MVFFIWERSPKNRVISFWELLTDLEQFDIWVWAASTVTHNMLSVVARF